MSDVEFDCPFCGQGLLAEDTKIGLFVECPACGEVLQVPRKAVISRSSGVGTADEESVSKSDTIRLDLPRDGGVPPDPTPRKFVVRRRPS